MSTPPSSSQLLSRRRLFAGAAAGAVGAVAAPNAVHAQAGTVETVAGGGLTVADGVAALAAAIRPWGIAVAPDESIVFTDPEHSRVWRLSGGVVRSIAGTGTAGFNARSTVANLARVSFPTGVAVAEDGTVYFADTINARVRKVLADGTISTVAGDGIHRYAGDANTAAIASLAYPNGVAVGRDGFVYIADTRNYRIRRVDASGVITTVAGTGEPDATGEATGRGAAVGEITALLGTADGIYFTEVTPNRLALLDYAGEVHTIATRVGDSYGLAQGSDGTLYVGSYLGSKVLGVSRAGDVRDVAGTGQRGFGGDGGPPLGATFSAVMGIAAGGDGRVYVADTGAQRIRAVSGVA